MDWSWLPDVLTWITQVNNAISNVTSVLGFITVVAAGIGFLLARIFKDPFGPRVPKPARYTRFFQSLVTRVFKRDKTLDPPPVIGGAAACRFKTNLTGLAYKVHFQADGRYVVYVALIGADAKRRFEKLQRHEEDLKNRFGLLKRPNLFRRLLRRNLVRDSLELAHDTHRSVYRVALYYHDPVAIVDDGKKLKRVRKWTLTRLLVLRRAVDEYLAEPTTAKHPAVKLPATKSAEVHVAASIGQ